jgi:hypothetical protein
MLLVAVLALQPTVEMKEFRSSYVLQAPAAYSDARSWPAVLEFHGEEETAAKAAEGWRAEKGCFVIAPRALGGAWTAKDAAFVKACLDDAKSRVRIDPLRVLASGGDAALEWAASNPAIVSACFLHGAKGGGGRKEGAPPILLASGGPDDRNVALDWFARKAPPRTTLEIVQELIREKRFLDASLAGIDLMEQPEQARLARFQLSRVEGEGIMALGAVELLMSERRYLDAWTRCAEAAVQFSWMPSGEKIRKRLAQLEKDARVRAARQLDD